MYSYLSKLREELEKLKNGVSTHGAVWTGQSETPITIQANIASITTVSGELATIENSLYLKRKESRLLEKNLRIVADTIEAKAIGFHTTNPEELPSYGIAAPKEKVKKPVPSAVLVPVLVDDDDGIGFKVSTQADPDAEVYEWERGIATDPSDLNTIPKMVFYKQTLKTNFLDDEVTKGVRYFYRVRAVNANGEGPWSTAQSRVQ